MTAHIFSQLDNRDSATIARVGLVSGEQMPTLTDVHSAIGAEAFGVFVQWETSVVRNGETYALYYAAFEHTVIPMPPAEYDATASVMFLAQYMKSAGRPDVAAALVRNEKQNRDDAKPTKRRTRAEVAMHGKRVRGGKTFVDLSNPDLQIEEQHG